MENFEMKNSEMKNSTKKHHIEELLLALLPYWNNQITRPFKQYLSNGVSLEMYYCIQILRSFDGMLTMSELAKWMQIPKSQMTKLVNRLYEQGFVERTADLDDRRIIHIKITDSAVDFINNFLNNISCYDELFANMKEKDQALLEKTLETMISILARASNFSD